MNDNSSRLVDFRLNARIKLAFLWATIMALYIYADYIESKSNNLQP